MDKETLESYEIPLTALKAGEVGIITSIIVGSKDRGSGWGFKKRLMDLGLVPGTRVTVIKFAPFQGPLEISVRGSKLAIGRGIANRIFVKKEEA